jgi:hypothetical protein
MNCNYCYGLGYDASGYACACTCTDAAKVAKARPVARDREPLPPSAWRWKLGVAARYVLGLIALLFYAALLSAVLS